MKINAMMLLAVLMIPAAGRVEAEVDCPRAYPSGKSLSYSSGSMFYPNGRSLRYSSGTLYDSEGRLLPQGSTVRIKLQDDMSAVVGRQRESYEMVVRDGNVDVHIHFDQDQNIYCEFVRN